MNPTQRALFWGAVLGAIFGAGVAIGFGGGWSLIDTASLPLLLEERLLRFTVMFNILGIGLVVGLVWGLLCGVLVVLGKRIRPILITLFLLPILISIVFIIRNPTDGTFWLIELLLAPTLVGYGLLQLYLRFKRLPLIVLLVLISGFIFGYIPWIMNGRDTERALRRTAAYAQKHSITNYQISVTQAESGGYRTKIHREDGSILYCYSWPAELEFKECTPTPQ